MAHKLAVIHVLMLRVLSSNYCRC